MRKSFILFTLLLLIFALPALAADISGNWRLDMEGPAGHETVNFSVKVTGEKLTIDGEHSSFGKFQANGTLKGDVINMIFPFTVTGDLVNFVFDGIVKGDKMEGKKDYYPQTGANANKGPQKMKGVSEAWTAVKK
jgi:hypothetical protein